MISDFEYDSSETKTATAFCPAGKYVLGGGADFIPHQADPNPNSAPLVLQVSAPRIQNGNGWFARGRVIPPYFFTWSIRAFAICANVTTATVTAASEGAVTANGVAALPTVETQETDDTAQPNDTIFLPLVNQ